jgi:hypothetical protein
VAESDKAVTITVPVWLLWALGIPLAIVILFFAFIGFLVWKDWT